MNPPVTPELLQAARIAVSAGEEATPGPWCDDHDYIGTRAPVDGNIVACAPPKMMKASRENWPRNMVFMISARKYYPMLGHGYEELAKAYAAETERANKAEAELAQAAAACGEMRKVAQLTARERDELAGKNVWLAQERRAAEQEMTSTKAAHKEVEAELAELRDEIERDGQEKAAERLGREHALIRIRARPSAEEIFLKLGINQAELLMEMGSRLVSAYDRAFIEAKAAINRVCAQPLVVASNGWRYRDRLEPEGPASRYLRMECAAARASELGK